MGLSSDKNIWTWAAAAAAVARQIANSSD